MSNVFTVTCGAPPEPVKPSLAVYESSVRLTMEYSSFQMAPGFDDQFVWSRLFPRFPLSEPYEWPPPLTGDLARDVQILALSRINLLFNIGTPLPAGSPDELRRAAYQRYLSVEPTSVPRAESEAYARIFAEAGVYEDGDLYWERWIEPGQTLAAGLTGENQPDHPEETDIDVFLETLIRADLMERLSALQNP